MKKLFKSLVVALFPQRCAYCGKVISSNRIMCCNCEANLPRISGVKCRKCGREKDKCSCKGAEKYFDSLMAPFYFSGCVRKGIHAFKFRKSFRNYEAYAEEMAKTVGEEFGNVAFDFVTEVPMSRKSVRQRGYNQCFWLAKGVSEKLGIEHKPDVLVKLYETGKQHVLSFYLRKGNLTGVFGVSNPHEIEGKTILLCDDISTSGETLNECAKMLWLCGAKEIYCVAVALTLSNKKDKETRW
ncbi:MAG: ComF family protein [Clostridia bacterium]|nr:ComF family protein [Clostridia bacterium]